MARTRRQGDPALVVSGRRTPLETDAGCTIGPREGYFEFMSTHSIETKAAEIAARLAHDLRLSTADPWELWISQVIAEDLRRFPAEQVEKDWRRGMGLSIS
jgi:hypothetical protein